MSVIIIALNFDVNAEKEFTAVEGDSTVVPCPVTSIPEAKISWSFENSEIKFDGGSKQADRKCVFYSYFLLLCLLNIFTFLIHINRYFLLRNGSLLIVNTRRSDSGKYRCNATNQFMKKPQRSSFSKLTVVSRSNNDDNNDHEKSVLYPKLQNSIQKIKSGQNLILHCAGNAKKVCY